jgi:DNA-binding transcriptional LysR family regulator
MPSMIRNLDLGLVRTFVAVADMASMTVAANALHLTQGAVSQQVKRLEEALGCSLFKRDRRGLRLTPAGERLFGHARRLLSLNDEIWAEMTTSAVEGRIRLGLPHDLVGSHLTPVLKAYAEAFPRVELTLVCASSPELVEALTMGRVDLAVVEEPVGPSAGECLSIERLVWVGAKAGTAHLKRPLPVSMVADTCAFRPAVLAALNEHGVPWRTVFENGSIEATAATVRADLAVTAWLASTAPPDLDILPAAFGLPDLPNFAISLCLPRHPPGTATVELARYVRDQLLQHRHRYLLSGPHPRM